jgi:hypothetical protein
MNGEAILLSYSIFGIVAVLSCVIFLMKSDGGTFFGKDDQD